MVALESGFFPHPKPLLALPSSASPSSPTVKELTYPPASIAYNGSVDATDVTTFREEIPTGDVRTSRTIDNLGVKMGVKHLTIKSVLNVFDGALNEVRATLSDQEIISFEGSSDLGSEMKMMSRKFQEQRLAELELLARRWKLLIEEGSNQEQI